MTDRPAPDDPKRRKFPLADQAEAAAEEMHRKYKRCLARVKAGEMSQEAADDEIAVWRAIRDTMRLFSEHESPIRDLIAYEIRRRREAAEHAAEIEEMKKHPAVGAVLNAFPDADVGLPREPAPADITSDPPPFDPDQEEPAAA
jgi:hypothetical protein